MGKVGTPLRSAYSASKHALHGFFDSLRAEIWKDNIHVTIICLGYIRTNVSLNALTEKGEKYNKMDDGQLKGMDSKQCARQILNAIKSKKKEVLIGKKEILAVYVKRFFPSTFSKIIRTASSRGRQKEGKTL